MCSESLITLRLGCPGCGTEVSGHFESCRYCRLDASDQAILEVFLRARGNVRDVQAFLGVSYPTARARLAEVLDRLGLGSEPETRAAPGTTAGGRPLVGPGPGPVPSTWPGPAPSPAPSGVPPAGPGPDTAAILADLAEGRIDVATAEALLAR